MDGCCGASCRSIHPYLDSFCALKGRRSKFSKGVVRGSPLPLVPVDELAALDLALEQVVAFVEAEEDLHPLKAEPAAH